jgi:hypothetical protein
VQRQQQQNKKERPLIKHNKILLIMSAQPTVTVDFIANRKKM